MKFVIADKSHGAQLCRLMKDIPVPGYIQVAFGRDPDFFYGLNIEGKVNQAIVAIEEDKVIGMGCRSIKPMYINGRKANFGYLSGLRGSEAYRGATGLARGFKFLRRLHEDRQTDAYITTIIDDNVYAKKLLESGRAGLPRYIDLGKYYTFAINMNRWRRARSPRKGISVIRGNACQLKEIVSFLNRFGKERQFFPAYTEEDFSCEYTRDFSPADFYVAIQNGRMIGVLGKWDQSGFKQNIVTGYAGYLKTFRHPINLALTAVGFKALPRPGERLKMFLVSFVCTSDNDPQVLTYLLDAVYRDDRAKGYHYCVIGFHEKDPLREVMKRYLSVRYTSRLYLVAWEDGLGVCSRIERDRIPYLEIGTI
jgi:hypothetical protein